MHPKPKTTLLARDDFRHGVFERDRFQCVVCGAPAVDAHHIIERRLFKAAHEKGGYFLDNGASLCEKHHIEAEQTVISCQTIRQLCGITSTVLPEHFQPGLDYDKWGNIITPEGRLKGELYYEMSVRAILNKVTFLPYFLHPKPCYLPWSKAGPECPVLENDTCFEAEAVVVTLIAGGVPFTAYAGYCHGENIDTALPPAIKALLLQKLAVLDDDMRVCGRYSGRHVCISAVWIENDCLDWEETTDFVAFLDMPLPVVLFEGIYDRDAIMLAFENAALPEKLGYEVRLKKGFRMFDLGKSVAQYNRFAVGER